MNEESGKAFREWYNTLVYPYEPLIKPNLYYDGNFKRASLMGWYAAIKWKEQQLASKQYKKENK